MGRGEADSPAPEGPGCGDDGGRCPLGAAAGDGDGGGGRRRGWSPFLRLDEESWRMTRAAITQTLPRPQIEHLSCDT